MKTHRTRVGIIGAGAAGLLLSQCQPRADAALQQHHPVQQGLHGRSGGRRRRNAWSTGARRHCARTAKTAPPGHRRHRPVPPALQAYTQNLGDGQAWSGTPCAIDYLHLWK